MAKQQVEAPGNMPVDWAHFLPQPVPFSHFPWRAGVTVMFPLWHPVLPPLLRELSLSKSPCQVSHFLMISEIASNLNEE